MLIDELHTPDSSRFWYRDTYEQLYQHGERQRKIDKEYLRQWLMDQGYLGTGAPPQIPDAIRVETARRYVRAFETLTGVVFEPTNTSISEELERACRRLVEPTTIGRP